MRVPGSKSITQRMLITAFLAKGETVLRNALLSEDTSCLMEALRLLGAQIEHTAGRITITGTGGTVQNPGKPILMGNNGTAMRFLTTLTTLGRGTFTIDGSTRLRERPVKPLLDALGALGATAHGHDGRGRPPVTVQAAGTLRGGTVTFTDIDSSQYVSSLLLAAPCSGKGIAIMLEGATVSMPYVDMTIDVMNRFGVSVASEENRFLVTAPQWYRASDHVIEGDLSSASYFFLAAAIRGGTVRVLNVGTGSRQGDRRFLDILSDLGCRITRCAEWIEVTGVKLHRGDRCYDMADMPDMVPSLAVLAAYREGTTMIERVAHLRKKESDRLRALACELNRIGITVREKADGLEITGGAPRGTTIRTYDDHRIAMSFAVAGLVTEGMDIENEGCVEKSFPGFWTEMEKLYG